MYKFNKIKFNTIKPSKKNSEHLQVDAHQTNFLTYSRGFTLLELLIALLIFSILGLAANFSLRSALQQYSVVKNSQASIKAYKETDFWLRQDLEQIIARPIRDEFGDTKPPIDRMNQAPINLEFTRTGISNPLERPQSSLVRVQYRLNEKQELIRKVYSRSDYTRQTDFYELVVAKNVKEIKWEVLGEDDQWLLSYNVLSKQGTPLLNAVPRAIKTSLSYQNKETQEIIVKLPFTGDLLNE